jgi:hypothetical protein
MSDQLFAGMRPVRPADDVKQNVLQAARAAASPRTSRVVAGWGFSRLDLAWVTALVLLVACHAVLFVADRVGTGSPGAERSRVAERRLSPGDHQLARELGVSPSLVAAARPSRSDGAREEFRRLLDDPSFERL